MIMVLRRNLQINLQTALTIAKTAMKKESLKRKEAMILTLTLLKIRKTVIKLQNLWLALECPK